MIVQPSKVEGKQRKNFVPLLPTAGSVSKPSFIYKGLSLGIAISVICAWTGTAFTEFTTVMHIIGTIGMERPAHTIYRILWIAPDQNDKFRFYPLLFAFRHFWFPLIGKNSPHKKVNYPLRASRLVIFLSSSNAPSVMLVISKPENKFPSSALEDHLHLDSKTNGNTSAK